MKKTLAIDYGTVRVGLAASFWSLAEPLYVLPNDENLIENILETIRDENIEQVLIGISENQMAETSRQFAQLLGCQTSLPIIFADETLSSHAVERKLQATGIKQKKRSGAIDHFAAAQFLQEWLDEQESGDSVE